MKHDAIVVGAGHNGLIAACYLALAGRQVLVLEALDRPGGGSRTEETVPGHLFDLHSVAHNMINMTSIPGELDLGDAGLVYQEMDPFSVAIHADGRRVRFHRSVDETVASIAEHSDDDARAYEQFMTTAMPIVQAVLPGVTGEGSWQRLPRRMATVAGILRRGRFDVVRDVLGPYDSLLRRHLATELTRGPVAAFAAHAGVGPSLPGGALFAFWQAAYHLFGQWHARGGAQGLTDALLVRLGDLGVEVRCSSPVERIEAPGGAVRAVVTEDGDRLPTTAVVTTVNPRNVLLGLLDPPLGGRDAADIAAVRRGNVVQALVHVATDRLPPYPDARPGDWNGLQSYVDEVEVLRRAWIESEAGLMPDVLALYAFTTSALDPTLAPPGHHTVYLACPAAPSRVRGGWESCRDRFVERTLDIVEERAPGFRSSVVGVHAWTPDRMEAEGRWPGAHPMHLDIALDQLGFFRPTPRLAGHRAPVAGLYLSGAGTAPSGGIAGTPGRLAARALIADQDRRRR